MALLAHVHLGNRGMTPARLAEIVDQAKAFHPDLVLLPGDFVTGHDAQGAAERPASLTQPLTHLRARLGVVTVLGNHDYWTAPGAVRAALSKVGVVVLEN